MKKVAISALTLSLMVTPVVAQQAGPSAVKDPLSSWLRLANMVPRNRLMGFAEKMPEEHFGMRPGTQTDGRSFGQYIGHVANLNYVWCSQAKGEKNPSAGKDLEKLTSKVDLVTALREAFAYCDGAYGALTDASGMEIIDATQENGQPLKAPRVAVLILNYGHNNEVFGDLNTFMRIQNL